MRPHPPVTPSQDRPSLVPSLSTLPTDLDQLSLTLTVRHLPTDQWKNLTVPVEWRAVDLKRLALERFDGHHQIESAEIKSTRTRPRGSGSSSQEADRPNKENDRGSVGETSGDSLLSVGNGVSEREKRTPSGVKRFANALRDRLSSKDFNSATGSLPPRTSPSPLRPLNASISSISPLPNRHSISASSTPTNSTFNLETPTRSRVRRSEDTHSRRSSIANFESLQLLAGRKKESLEAVGAGGGGGNGEEKEVLISLDEASPLTARRLERSKSLSDRSRDGSPVRSRKSPTSSLTIERDDSNLASWILVSAVTGGVVADHAIVGNKFVENDLLTLKPAHLLYDPPLNLYHLPYLNFTSTLVLPASLSTCRTTFEFSAGAKGHSRRRSFGGRYAKEELVDRRIEISVDDGVYAAAQGDREMTPGTTMVIKVIKVNQLEAIYSLPPDSIQLVNSSTSLSTPPPLPSSSSTASLANLILPSNSANLRQSVGPLPPSSRKRVKSLPLIQLSWEEGENLALRAKDKEDHERLMKILGEPDERDEAKDAREAQTRKDLIDLAFASRHNLLSSKTSSSRPTSSQAQNPRPRLYRSLNSHSISRPNIQPRSVSDSCALVPPLPASIGSDQHITPTRRSSVLHIRKRDSSLELDLNHHHPNRTPSSTSVSTFSDSPSTPTSLHIATPEPVTKTMITPATPHSNSLSYSPSNPSPASLISSSSSYFSLHSPPLVLPPFTYPRIPPSSSFTRAKSSLDLTSAIRNNSPLNPLNEITTSSSENGHQAFKRKGVRRVNSALEGRS
ncbi:hypothetical protein JCM3765_001201 [Sporobolomyces pararoseus]